METCLSPEAIRQNLSKLVEAEKKYFQHYPGEGGERQPVHTVYGGAHLFKAKTATKLGQIALGTLNNYAPDPFSFARALQLSGYASFPTSLAAGKALANEIRQDSEKARRIDRSLWLATTLYDRVVEKLKSEPVEDFRIDFEDGYGNRPEEEEDGHAQTAAQEVASGMKDKLLPPFIGIRIKPLSQELRQRSVRTLDLFVTKLSKESGGKLPDNFVVTLPKVTMPEQVLALKSLFESIEKNTDLTPGSLKMELMIEQTQAIFDPRGAASIPGLIHAGGGRVVSAHFGTYDYTATCNIIAEHQSMTHASCDFAKHVMQTTLAGTGVWLSDGATNIMPIAPHRAPKEGPGLSPRQLAENLASVHSAWKLHFDQATHSLLNGFYQGWDLHPGQLPTRYAAVYAFFLEGLDSSSERLTHFVNRAAQATLVGDVFDDAATGQGLLNFFLRARSCGAITEDEAIKLSGLSSEELNSRSFVKILDGRREG